MPLTPLLDMSVITTILHLLIIAVFTILAQWGLRQAAGQLSHQADRRIQDAEQAERVKTIIHVVRGALLVVVVIVAVLMVLQALKIDVTPLLAGVGVVGLALSLGAQTLIKDYVGGLLILIENQFAIGDVIQVGSVSGEVERITLRATCLRDVDGRYHVVPNGDIRLVSNLTMEWARAVVDLNVDYSADMDRVLRALEKAADRARTDDAVRTDLLEPPQVQGWVGFKEGAIQVRMRAKTRPGKQWDVARVLRRYAIEALQAESISVTLPA